MLPVAVQSAVESHLSLREGRTIIVTRIQAVTGGNISRAYQVVTPVGSYFLKYKERLDESPIRFEIEARGLDLLQLANGFRIPKVLAASDQKAASFLLLEFLEKGPLHPRSWFESGQALARQHRITQKKFGLDHDNFIGSLPQSNANHATWADFFVEERILPQLQMARDKQALTYDVVRKTERFCQVVPELFPQEQPALLHGDLWSGNFFVSLLGPAVFDPAVYFGHREMDIAMTNLFGGFGADFYTGYEENFPLEKNWKARQPFAQVYPLLVHTNLFGGGYVRDLLQIVKAFA